MYWNVFMFTVFCFVGVAGMLWPLICTIMLIPWWLEWTDSKTYQWGCIIGSAVICFIIQTIATYQFYLTEKKKNDNK